MAYREQMHQPGEGYNGNGQQRLGGPNEGSEGGDEFAEDDSEDLLDEAASRSPPPGGPAASPVAIAGSRQHGGYDGNRHERRLPARS